MSAENPLKKEFRKLERNVLILTAVPLPFFSFSYLYTTGGTMQLAIPSLPPIFSPLLLWTVIGLLLLQTIQFRKEIRAINAQPNPITEKFKAYAVASHKRFYILFAVGFLSAAGLLIYEMPGFTITYAVCLVFVSLGKPTPDRIIRGLRLKGEEKDLVYEINRRDP
jgi:hypothetical protein